MDTFQDIQKVVVSILVKHCLVQKCTGRALLVFQAAGERVLTLLSSLVVMKIGMITVMRLCIPVTGRKSFISARHFTSPRPVGSNVAETTTDLLEIEVPPEAVEECLSAFYVWFEGEAVVSQRRPTE